MTTPRAGSTSVTSVSIPTETLEAIRARVGKKGLSAFVTEAVQRELHRQANRDALAELVAETGPVDENELRQTLERLDRHHTTHRTRASDAA